MKKFWLSLLAVSALSVVISTNAPIYANMPDKLICKTCKVCMEDSKNIIAIQNHINSLKNKISLAQHTIARNNEKISSLINIPKQAIYVSPKNFRIKVPPRYINHKPAYIHHYTKPAKNIKSQIAQLKSENKRLNDNIRLYEEQIESLISKLALYQDYSVS